jgi:hypothetical protein
VAGIEVRSIDASQVHGSLWVNDLTGLDEISAHHAAIAPVDLFVARSISFKLALCWLSLVAAKTLGQDWWTSNPRTDGAGRKIRP